jgi:hypothetical protein
VAAVVGQRIEISLATIGPGSYGTPDISSGTIRFWNVAWLNLLFASPPDSLFSARVIDQDSPHRLRSYSKKLCAILPFCIFLGRQLHIRLVNEGCGLQCVVGTLAREMTRR